MTFSRLKPLILVGVGLTLCSCQPAPQESLPREAPILDVTLLGIWPARDQAYEIANALEEFGIRSTMSGISPCLINVETAKLQQSRAIVAQNSAWVQSAISLH